MDLVDLIELLWILIIAVLLIMIIIFLILLCVYSHRISKDINVKDNLDKENLLTIVTPVMACIALGFIELYINIAMGFYFLFLGLIFTIIGFFVIREKDKTDIYMVKYLAFSAAYMAFIFLFSGIFNPCLIDFLKSNSSKNEISKIFGLFACVLISMVFLWIWYFHLAMKQKDEYENIDMLEMKIIFLKSLLQSIITFIALFGLAGWGLPNFFLLCFMFVDAFAAFSYPILDINKYLRQKEKEAFEKNYASIKPNDKSKE